MDSLNYARDMDAPGYTSLGRRIWLTEWLGGSCDGSSGQLASFEGDLFN